MLVSRDFSDLTALIRDLPVSPLLRLPAHRATHRTVDERAARRRRAGPATSYDRQRQVPPRFRGSAL
jgi:hypothetical protein